MSSFTEIFKNYKDDFKDDLKTIFLRNTVRRCYLSDKIFLNVQACSMETEINESKSFILNLQTIAKSNYEKILP